MSADSPTKAAITSFHEPIQKAIELFKSKQDDTGKRLLCEIADQMVDRGRCSIDGPFSNIFLTLGDAFRSIGISESPTSDEITDGLQRMLKVLKKT